MLKLVPYRPSQYALTKHTSDKHLADIVKNNRDEGSVLLVWGYDETGRLFSPTEAWHPNCRYAVVLRKSDGNFVWIVGGHTMLTTASRHANDINLHC